MPRFFCNILSIPKNDYINLVHVGWDKCTPNYSYSQYRDMYILQVIKSGVATIDTDGHRYTLGKNDAFLVKPFELTIHTADKNQPCELYFFAFSGQLAEQLLAQTVFKNDVVFSSLKDESFYDLVVDIALDLNKNPNRNLTTYQYLFQLLSYFDITEKAVSVHKNNSDSFYQKYISTIQEQIQLNYAKSIKISDLATQLGLSRSHLYRIFKAETGYSIEEYLVSVRINAARSLLSETNFSCSSIASLVGYAHYTTFFKIFKNNTGYTPQQYRAKMKKALEENENNN